MLLVHFHLFYVPEYIKHVYHLFVIKVKGKNLADRKQKRDQLQKFLGENEIASGLHYPVPLHLQKCFEHLGYKKGDFPVTEELAESGLSLPMYAELTNEQIQYVADSINKFFEHSSNNEIARKKHSFVQ